MEHINRVQIVVDRNNRNLGRVIQTVARSTAMDRMEVRRAILTRGVIDHEFTEEEFAELQRTLAPLGATITPFRDADRREATLSSIEGTVTHGDESLSGYAVHLYHRPLPRRDVAVAVTTTDEQGRYAFSLDDEEVFVNVQGELNPFIRVVDEHGTLLAESEVILDTGERRSLTIDVAIPANRTVVPSEFEAIEARLERLGVPAHALSREDVEFLERDFGPEQTGTVEAYVRAARLAGETGVSRKDLYALARSGSGELDVDQLLATDLTELAQRFDRAVTRDLVRLDSGDGEADLDARVERIRTRLRRARWQQRDVRVRVVDGTTGEPLDDGYAVSLGSGDRPVDGDVELTAFEDGAFILVRSRPSRSDDPGEETFSVPIVVRDRDGEVVAERELGIRAGDRRLEMVVPTSTEPGDVSLDRLRDEGALDLSAETLAELDTRGIRSLSDVRRAGGTQRLDAPDLLDEETAERLDAHAELSLVTEPRVGSALIDRGFRSIHDIASTTREAFVRSLADETELDARTAVAIHDGATAGTRFLRNAVVDARTSWRNNIGRTALDSGALLALRQGPEPCSCDECESAVNPRAYLADLLDYVIEHVRSDEEEVSLPFLVGTYHQPFVELLGSCETVEERVRQARIAVEVLLRLVGEDDFQFLVDDPDAIDLRATMYETLLRQFGTTADELRRALDGDDVQRRRLAERLGVEPDHLPEFELDPTAPIGSADAVSEDVLERLFGLPAVTHVAGPARDRLVLADPLDPSDDGDGSTEPEPPLFQQWRTERLHRIWHREDHPVDAYQTGAEDPSTPDASSGPERAIIDPDLVGPGDFRRPDPDATVGADDHAVRAFGLWLRRHDWVDGRLTELRETPPEDGQPPLESLLDMQFTAQDDPDALVYAGESHAGPWHDGPNLDAFDALAEQLSEASATTADATEHESATAEDADVRSSLAELHLTVEEFQHLMALREKHHRWRTDPRNDPVSDDEWAECYSILVQTQKRSLTGVWIDEERDVGVEFGPETFWPSLNEPKIGPWPPRLDAGEQIAPYLDPEIVDREQLPDGVVGREARAVLAERSSLLDERRDAFETAYWDDDDGFEALLTAVYGEFTETQIGLTTNGETIETWTEYFEHRSQDLSSADDEAVETVNADAGALGLDVDEFTRVAEFAVRSTDSDSSPPSDEMVSAAVDLLTTAWKRLELYPDTDGESDGPWVNEERARNLRTGWRVRKLSLPRWRGTQSDRSEWQRALRVRSREPLVDPDLVDFADVNVESEGGGARVALLTERRARLEEIEAEVFAALDVPGDVNSSDIDPIDVDLDAGLESVVGVTLAALRTLAAEEERGRDPDRRLQQLSLSRAAYRYLVGLASQPGDAFTGDEVTNLQSILVQVRKRRLAARFLAEERAAGIVLSPLQFRVPDSREQSVDGDSEPPPEPSMVWRRDPTIRRRWERLLEGRTEQLATVGSAGLEAVDAVEEETYPRYRDLLADAASIPDDVSNDTAWLTARLGVDMETDGCQKVTRVSQAIETLQGLVFALRTGTGLELPPGIGLELHDDAFETRWRVLGSYATWKAFMTLFLYPENVLLPTLRSPEMRTPAFDAIARQTGPTTDVTPSLATSLYDDYYRYLRDVLSLTVEATCWGRTPLPTRVSGDRREYRRRYAQFLFARGHETNRLYWATYDPVGVAGYRQSYWEELPLPFDQHRFRILGANTYYGKWLVLFLKQRERGPRPEPPVLTTLVYDLSAGRWEPTNEDPTLTSIPAVDEADYDDFQAVVMQDNSLPDDALSFDPVVLINAGGRLVGKRYDPGGGSWSERQLQNAAVAELRYSTLLGLIGRGPSGVLFYLVRPDSDEGYELRLVNLTFENPVTIPPGSEPLTIKKDLDRDCWQGAIRGEPLIETEFVFPRVHAFWTKDGDHFVSTYEGSVSTQEYSLGKTVREYRFAVASSTSDVSHGTPDVASGFDFTDVVGGGGPPTGGSTVQPYNEQLVFQYVHDGRRVVRRAKLLTEDGVVQGSNETDAAPKPVFDGLVPDLRHDTDPIGRFRTETHELHGENHTQKSHQTYLHEAYYFVPLHLALRLQRSGHFEEALEWLRTVYDYGLDTDRRISYLLDREGGATAEPVAFGRPDDWLFDATNPHAHASLRSNAYTRFTLFTVVRCLLDYADSEFTRDTPESVPRARDLYETALDVLAAEGLGDPTNPCVGVNITVGDDGDDGDVRVDIQHGSDVVSMNLGGVARADVRGFVGDLAVAMNRLETPALRTTAVETVRTTLEADNVSVDAQFTNALARVRELAESEPDASDTTVSPTSVTVPLDFAAARDARSDRVVAAHRMVLSEPGFARTVERLGTPNRTGSGSRRFGAVPVSPPDPDDGVIPAAPLELVGEVIGTSVGRYTDRFCVPENPILATLRARASLNLQKIRTCRNIAGMERSLEPYAAPTDVASSLPSLSGSGRLTLPGTVEIQPTPYRYRALVERATELANVARGIEADYLRALERRDDEAYRLLEARQDVDRSQAGVRLQGLRVNEARAGVRLAELQRDLSTIKSETYEEWLEAGMNSWEQTMIDAYYAAGEASSRAEMFGAMTTMFNLMTEAASGGLAAPAAMVTAMAGTMTAMTASMFRTMAINAEVTGQVAQVHASHERRVDEWELGSALAKQESRIGEQGIAVATAQLEIAEGERDLVEQQAEHAREIVEFLESKFTSVELYDWMVGVLADTYRFFLQQATAIAKLAENQLAFERQEPPMGFVRTDYWTPPSDGVFGDPEDREEGPDRRGLTGSVRLLRDVYHLDQYAFRTNERKLRVEKTVSLARYAPVEFQQFRKTGELPFTTPMELFDRDHPGQYLRLIENVDVSVIALTPPEGINATLTASGISRVVTGGDVFQTRTIRRQPESITLSAPFSDDGRFDLRPDSDDLLRPFEKMGVDTTWEFRMPEAANQFAYDMIADVLVTIEYTALDSADYRHQLIRELDPEISAERAFSVRHAFADAWYELNNPETVADPMTVRFTTRRENFPPNLTDLRFDHVLLSLVGPDDGTLDGSEVTLTFDDASGHGPFGGTAGIVENRVSTRSPSASNLSAITTSATSVEGEWTLTLPNTPTVRELFEQDVIEDILFVISYSGMSPEWPESTTPP